MLAGIRSVVIVCRSQDEEAFKRLLGQGDHLGLRINYVHQDEPRGIGHALGLIKDPGLSQGFHVILGDNFLFGRAIQGDLPCHSGDAGILGFTVGNLSDYGVIKLDQAGNPLSVVEKPTHSPVGLAIAGFYFLPGDAPTRLATAKASSRGEVELTDLLNEYLTEGRLRFSQPGRGAFWQDMGTSGGIQRVSDFVAVWQQRTGVYIACLEEIAIKQGWADPASVLDHMRPWGSAPYAVYVREVARQVKSGT